MVSSAQVTCCIPLFPLLGKDIPIFVHNKPSPCSALLARDVWPQLCGLKAPPLPKGFMWGHRPLHFSNRVMEQRACCAAQNSSIEVGEIV